MGRLALIHSEAPIAYVRKTGFLVLLYKLIRNEAIPAAPHL